MSPYQELLERLLQVNKYGTKLGLTNIQRLNDALGNPVNSFPAIHVAGTNGKGSVCTKIATGLQASGLRVGLYTSPHISCFRERIKINGLMISEPDMARHLSRIFEVCQQEKIPATFFEITSMLAFTYYAEQKIDMAVIETGLGGRLDATNIVNTKLSVITSISLDHTEILGTTLKEIAHEKAGIIKPQIPVVLGPHLPRHLFEEAAIKSNSPCTCIEGSFDDYYAENNAIAGAALKHLNIPAEAIKQGLKALPPCRLETHPPLPHTKAKAIILDVAHNPDGLTQLLKALKNRYPNFEVRFVLGLSANKDLTECLKVILKAGTHFHLVEATNGRAVPKETIQQQLIHLGIPSSHITCEPSIETGLQHACQQSHENELIVICGTFFIMSAARKTLGIQEPRDPTDLNEHIPKTNNLNLTRS